MLLIVAHHYVVNSGLYELIRESTISPQSITMLIFGAWGKTGINCFVFITGYFMCKSQITGIKLLKLYLQILFYTLIIYGVFCITGHEPFSIIKIIKRFWPIYNIQGNFVSCFLIFYLLIPYLNILVNHLNKRQHLLLAIILLLIYSVLSYFPFVTLSYNYVTWFCVVYIIASYCRFYDIENILTHRQWGLFSIALILVGSLSIIGLKYLHSINRLPWELWVYHFVADSNKLLSIAIALCSFMYFKGLKIPHSRFINAIGASTFGVLLIHANSDAMRQWLWRETVDCMGHFGDSVLWTLGYATISVLIIFTVCSGIDWFRGKFIEPHLINAASQTINKIKDTKLVSGLTSRINAHLSE